MNTFKHKIQLRKNIKQSQVPRSVGKRCKLGGHLGMGGCSQRKRTQKGELRRHVQWTWRRDAFQSGRENTEDEVTTGTYEF